MARLTTHREFDQLIVIRVTTNRYWCAYIHPFRFLSYGYEKCSSIVLIEVAAEFFSGENCGELDQQRKRKQNPSILKRMTKRLTRR